MLTGEGKSAMFYLLTNYNICTMGQIKNIFNMGAYNKSYPNYLCTICNQVTFYVTFYVIKFNIVYNILKKI